MSHSSLPHTPYTPSPYVRRYKMFDFESPNPPTTPLKGVAPSLKIEVPSSPVLSAQEGSPKPHGLGDCKDSVDFSHAPDEDIDFKKYVHIVLWILIFPVRWLFERMVGLLPWLYWLSTEPRYQKPQRQPAVTPFKDQSVPVCPQSSLPFPEPRSQNAQNSMTSTGMHPPVCRKRLFGSPVVTPLEDGNVSLPRLSGTEKESRKLNESSQSGDFDELYALLEEFSISPDSGGHAYPFELIQNDESIDSDPLESLLCELQLSHKAPPCQKSELEVIFDGLLRELDTKSPLKPHSALHSQRLSSEMRPPVPRSSSLAITREQVQRALKGCLGFNSDSDGPSFDYFNWESTQLELYHQIATDLKRIEEKQMDIEEHLQFMYIIEVFLQACRPIVPPLSPHLSESQFLALTTNLPPSSYIGDVKLYRERIQQTRNLFAKWCQDQYREEPIKQLQCRVMQEAIRFVVRVMPQANQSEYFRIAEILAQMNTTNVENFIQLRQLMQALFTQYHTKPRPLSGIEASMLLTHFDLHSARSDMLADVNAELGTLAVACGIELSVRCLIVIEGLNDSLLSRWG